MQLHVGGSSERQFMTDRDYILTSHYLCPYAQRVAISLAEKGIAHRKRYIDLANKPDWFLAISPMGKVPVLSFEHDGRAIALHDSLVILEYLEETHDHSLHPDDAVKRAEHRARISFGSSILENIAELYRAENATDFDHVSRLLRLKFKALQDDLGEEPYYDGEKFSLVDAVFGPIFRYFDVFDQIGNFGILDGNEVVLKWREALHKRPSVKGAVTEDYEARLFKFLKAKNSYLSGLIENS
jgi:glutathione S-transferase